MVYSATHKNFNKNSNELLVQNSKGRSEEMRLASGPLDPTLVIPLIPSWFQSKLIKAWIFFPQHGLV